MNFKIRKVKNYNDVLRNTGNSKFIAIKHTPESAIKRHSFEKFQQQSLDTSEIDYNKIDRFMYYKFLESLPDAALIIQKNIITYANRHALNLFNVSIQDEIINKNIFDVTHPDYHDIVAENLCNPEKTPDSIPIIEQKLFLHNSRVVSVETKSVCCLIADQEVSLLIMRDISSRKSAEEKLRQSEKLYRHLIELLPDAILIVCDKRIVFANSSSAPLLGFRNTNELIGRPMKEFVPIEYLDIFREYSHKILNDKYITPSVEYKYIKKDGSLIDVEGAAMPIFFNNKPSILIAVKDVSELKQAEELKILIQEKNRQLNDAVEIDKAKTEFYTNLSHELKTPINVILGSEQLISLYTKDIELMRNNTNKINRYLSVIRQNCNRLLRLIYNFIDISKIDSGYYEIELKEYDIVSLVENITLSVVDYVESNGISLIFDTDVEEKIIACDPDKIERVMLNLLSNAVKFTPNGGQIKVNLKTGEDFVEISVKDTGMGIEADKIDMIFDRYKQIEKSYTRNHQGSGIGLALVKSIVEMHSGKIFVYSDYGKGSEFIITLPAINPKSNPMQLKSNIEYLNDDHIEKIQVEFADINST